MLAVTSTMVAGSEMAAGGVDDGRAAVGVADQDDRAGNGVDDAGDVGGVAGQVAQRVAPARWSDLRVPKTLDRRPSYDELLTPSRS
ncbi:hypothetical protein [Nonomuraea sp. NPDC049607]|uniref:hypothetical protein n=1 Tax=Nonomuraea sp. NPDC049607 TaxID=3154732 RepID=UPI0034151D60